MYKYTKSENAKYKFYCEVELLSHLADTLEGTAAVRRIEILHGAIHLLARIADRASYNRLAD